MAVQVLGFDGNPFDQRSILPGLGRFIRTLVQLKLTGNYTTGGDTLDFTNGGGTPAAPNTVPNLQSASPTGPSRVSVNDGPVAAAGVLGAGGCVVVLAGTNPTNWKLKIFKNTAGSVGEYANGAYGADATSETIILACDWAR